MLKTGITLSEIGMMLKPVFIQNNVKRAAVFGSYARGEQSDASDMDFVVEFVDGASLLDLGGLFEDVREVMGRDVDILTYHSLSREPEYFATNVMRDIRVIYESD
jgi:hypothetical protein